MQVMVFIAKAADNGGRKPTLLALPASSEAVIPAHLRTLDWSYYAQMDAGDASLGGTNAKVADHIAKNGFAEVPFRLSAER